MVGIKSNGEYRPAMRRKQIPIRLWNDLLGWYGKLIVALLLSVGNSDASTHATPDVKIKDPLGWQISGTNITFQIGEIINGSGRTTGSLELQLWASTTPYPGEGFLLGEYPLDPLSAGYHYPALSVSAGYTAPPDGVYYTTYVLDEYTSSGWVTNTFATLPQAAVWTAGNATALVLDKTSVIPFEFVVAAGAFDTNATITVQLAYGKKMLSVQPLRVTTNQVRFVAPPLFNGAAFIGGTFEVSVLQQSGTTVSNYYGKLTVADLPEVRMKAGMVTASFVRATQGLLNNASTNLVGPNATNAVLMTEITNAQGFLQSLLQQIKVPSTNSPSDAKDDEKFSTESEIVSDNPNAIYLTGPYVVQMDRFCAGAIQACARNTTDPNTAEMFTVWASATTAITPNLAEQAKSEAQLEASEQAFNQTIASSANSLTAVLESMTAPFSATASLVAIYGLSNPAVEPFALQLGAISDVLTTGMMVGLYIDAGYYYYKDPNSLNAPIYLQTAQNLATGLMVSKAFDVLKDYHSLQSLKTVINTKNAANLIIDIKEFAGDVNDAMETEELISQLETPSESLSAVSGNSYTYGGNANAHSGTWSGSYQYTSGGSCTWSDGGDVNITLSTVSGSITGTITFDGIQCRDLSTCALDDVEADSGTAAGNVISGNTVSITCSVASTSGTCAGQALSITISGTLTGTTLEGKLSSQSDSTLSGTLTAMKQD